MMKLTKELRTGIGKIDSQHETLVDLINLLESEQHCDKEKTLTALYAYVDLHFKYEEALMRLNGYPFYEQHKRLHVFFLEKIEQSSRNKRGDCEEIRHFLCDWLLNHIGKSDQDYVSWVKDTNVSLEL